MRNIFCLRKWQFFLTKHSKTCPDPRTGERRGSGEKNGLKIAESSTHALIFENPCTLRRKQKAQHGAEVIDNAQIAKPHPHGEIGES